MLPPRDSDVAQPPTTAAWKSPGCCRTTGSSTATTSLIAGHSLGSARRGPCRKERPLHAPQPEAPPTAGHSRPGDHRRRYQDGPDRRNQHPHRPVWPPGGAAHPPDQPWRAHPGVRDGCPRHHRRRRGRQAALRGLGGRPAGPARRLRPVRLQHQALRPPATVQRVPPRWPLVPPRQAGRNRPAGNLPHLRTPRPERRRALYLGREHAGRTRPRRTCWRQRRSWTPCSPATAT